MGSCVKQYYLYQISKESDKYFELGICFRYGSIQNLNQRFVVTNRHKIVSVWLNVFVSTTFNHF